MAQPILQRVDGVPPMTTQTYACVKRTMGTFRAPTNATAWKRQAAGLRRRLLRDVYLRGWPKQLITRRPPVVWGDVLDVCDSYRIRKLRYEIYPDYWVPALLYEPTGGRGAVPAVLNANGHHIGGKAVVYKQARCANLARRGMLALSTEFVGMGELSADHPHDDLAAMDATGMSVAGLFYLAMSKGLDVLTAHRRTDPRRVAMTGLSGGGWQTITLSALDERIRLCVPVAGYTSLLVRAARAADRGDIEQLPPDMGTIAGYQTLTALLAPRPVLHILNEQDTCCFRPDLTKPAIYDAIRPTYRAFGVEENIQYHINTDPGTHNYEADNRRQLYRFLDRHFGLQTPDGDIHTPEDMLPEHVLNVGLPGKQTAVRTVARNLARQQVAARRSPRTELQRRRLREKLTRVIHLPTVRPRTEAAGTVRGAKLYRLRLGPWTSPVAVVRRSDDRRATLIVAEDAAAQQTRAESVTAGTVAMADVFYLGACRCEARTSLLVHAAGSRVLGIQAAQILAAASLVKRAARASRVELVAMGQRCVVAALFAAAVKPLQFKSLSLTGLPASLAHLLEKPMPLDVIQSALCPDILTVADTAQLIALLEGVPLEQPDRFVPVSRS